MQSGIERVGLLLSRKCNQRIFIGPMPDATDAELVKAVRNGEVMIQVVDICNIVRSAQRKSSSRRDFSRWWSKISYVASPIFSFERSGAAGINAGDRSRAFS
ncbi:hypothetical protein HNP46_000121 [Pseudomonas nitritireducens]|uniref:Uncharacterized protein n=1 Tax=Pseudomonas nitroreducens TaxID=46680 RepID=A0A7W7KED4_PSENT|nr:hypothetical protein [Pseudomonas nitritireducens]MBB4861310.1 hypothetical protein [Pseudomonas nitritireducens]